MFSWMEHCIWKWQLIFKRSLKQVRHWNRSSYDMLFCLFVWFDSLHPINNLSVIKGRVFLGWTSTKLGLMCLAQGHNAVTLVRLELAAPRSRVKHSTTKPMLFYFNNLETKSCTATSSGLDVTLGGNAYKIMIDSLKQW